MAIRFLLLAHGCYKVPFGYPWGTLCGDIEK